MTQQMTYPGHARAITVMGLPLVGGHLGQIAIGVSDTVMAGWYSVEALAAVTLASTYFFVLLIFGSGFAWGVMPLVAAFDAEGDEVGLIPDHTYGEYVDDAVVFIEAAAEDGFSDLEGRGAGKGSHVSSLCS